ncbi:porin family protein [uncultured Shimia sp.]|uniref:tetratricopeptide repeat protein n=1 Tax=uncultured Shimia sp. TaxID=573152 RepID=UPI0026276A7B|nr:porin family protein [uncultured Shimia sp.]
MAKVLSTKPHFCLLALALLFAAAAMMPGQAQATTPPATVLEIERSFDQAMAALDAGQPEAAIPLLQDILALDPKLIRVRLELARAYFMAQQWARSREEFFRVLSGDLPEPVRKTVLSFIRQIDARRGFDWDLSIGFTTAGGSRTYDSDIVNANTAFGVLPFSITRADEERLPAVTATGAMNFRRALGSNAAGTTTSLGFASLGFDLLEAEGRRYDSLQLRAKFGLRLLSEKTTASIAPFASTQWAAGDPYEDRFGIEAAFERRSLMGGSAYGGLSYAVVDNRANSAFDGRFMSALAGFRRSVGGRSIVGTELYYERRTADQMWVGRQGYQSLKWSIYSSVDVGRGWTLSPRLYVRHRDVLEQHASWVNSADETGIGGSLRLEKTNTFLPGGYTPYFQIDAERMRSDVEAFNSRVLGIQIGVERRF